MTTQSIQTSPIRLWRKTLCRENRKAAAIASLKTAGVLAAFIFLTTFMGLGSGELYRNETLRAYLAMEMQRDGHFIVPHLYGQPILTKPPGQYWFIAGLSLPFGQVTEWTARLPSALAASCLIVAVFAFLRPMFGLNSALFMACLMPCYWLWLERASSAEMDMLLTAWVGLAWLAFLQAMNLFEDWPAYAHRAHGWIVVSMLCVACGMLTKWTACIYFYVGMVPYVIWRGQWRRLFSVGHLIGIGMVVGLFGGWFLAVIQHIGWDSFWQQLRAEALPRVLASEHKGGVWLETLLHPFKIMLVMLPWSPLALVACHPYFWRHPNVPLRRLIQALHGCLWPNLLLFSLLPEHATRHSFPFTITVTLLASLVLWEGYHRLGNRSAPSILLRRVVFGIMLGWVCVKLMYVWVMVPMRDRDRQPSAKAAEMGKHIPPGEVLFLKQVKDEGMMFYYGRPVRRVKNWSDLPTNQTVMVIMTEAEFADFHAHTVRTIRRAIPLKDTQNDKIMLIELA